MPNAARWDPATAGPYGDSWSDYLVQTMLACCLLGELPLVGALVVAWIGGQGRGSGTAVRSQKERAAIIRKLKKNPLYSSILNRLTLPCKKRSRLMSRQLGICWRGTRDERAGQFGRLDRGGFTTGAGRATSQCQRKTPCHTKRLLIAILTHVGRTWFWRVVAQWLFHLWRESSLERMINT